MLRVTDLKAVTIATPDVEGAVSAFRSSFAFPITRSSKGGSGRGRSTYLGIGAAEIEMTAAAGDAVGLQELVLEVEDLAEATAALAARGLAIEAGVAADGRRVARLGPAHTHGVRLTLVGR